MRTYPIGGGFGRRLSSGLPPVELLKQTQQWPWYSMLSYQNPWILERSEGLCEPDLHVFAKFFEDRLWKGVLKPRHFLGVRLAVMTMSWISSSDSLSMSI
jgi:hypothetical protein